MCIQYSNNAHKQCFQGANKNALSRSYANDIQRIQGSVRERNKTHNTYHVPVYYERAYLLSNPVTFTSYRNTLTFPT